MPWALAKTPLTPVRAGLEWSTGVAGVTSRMSWVGRAVLDDSDAVDCGGVELVPDISSAFCCVVMGIAATRGGDAGAGVIRGDVVPGGRALPYVGSFLSRGSTETLTGSLADVVDADVE